ncbi:hypothetical protein E4U41_000173, partial [Claviceps citrina]
MSHQKKQPVTFLGQPTRSGIDWIWSPASRENFDISTAARHGLTEAGILGKLGSWEAGKLGSWEAGKLGSWGAGELGSKPRARKRAGLSQPFSSALTRS